MPISSQTRNLHCIELEQRYKEERLKLKKTIAERRVNKDVDMNRHMRAVFKLHSLPRNSSKTRIRNRCSITGRGRGVFRAFGICGMKIRELAMLGELPGVRHGNR
jgi:small subunit ribosomal protein S14